MLTTIAIENYRSLRHVVIPLAPLTVITGANGVGKSNLYRALRLLAENARNGAVAALARDGGFTSVRWAGPERVSRAMRTGEAPVQGTRRREPVALRLGFATDTTGYSVEFGLPVPGDRTLFGLDPEIKAEALWFGPVVRAGTLQAERTGPRVRLRDATDEWISLDHRIRPYDSMLSEVADPRSAPEVLALRDRVRGWRFYDHVRTDPDAPARRPQLGTRTPVLAHDASDLAAAVQTVREDGQPAWDRAIERAFPGSLVEVEDRDGWFSLTMRQPGVLRPLAAAELSDGTLRYIALATALLSPRPPEFLVLNEPETSLHPELLGPLAELVHDAAVRSQIVVVSHAHDLVTALAAQGASRIELVKELGETGVAGQGALDEPAWAWPSADARGGQLTARARSHPPAAAATPSTTFAATLATAVRARPSTTSCTVSTPNVENVVNPPHSPESRMSRASALKPPACARPSTAPPIAEPMTLTTSTAHGNGASAPRAAARRAASTETR